MFSFDGGSSGMIWAHDICDMSIGVDLNMVCTYISIDPIQVWPSAQIK